MKDTASERIENQHIYLNNLSLLQIFLNKEVIRNTDFFNFINESPRLKSLLPLTINWDSSDSFYQFFNDNETDDGTLDIICTEYLKQEPSINYNEQGVISFYNQSFINKAIQKLTITSDDIGQGESLARGFKLSPSYLKTKYGYNKKYYDTIDLAVLRRLDLVKSFLSNSRTKDNDKMIISEKSPFYKRAAIDFNGNLEENRLFIKEIENGIFASAEIDVFDPITNSTAYFLPCQKSNTSILSELENNAFKIAHDNFVINGNKDFESKMYILNKLNPSLLDQVKTNPEHIPSVSYKFVHGNIIITPDENFLNYFEASQISFPLIVPFTHGQWINDIMESDLAIVEEKFNLRDQYFNDWNKEEKIYNESLNVLNILDTENLPFKDFIDLLANSKIYDIEEECNLAKKNLEKLILARDKLKKPDAIERKNQEIILAQNVLTNKQDELTFCEKDIDSKIKELLNINPNSAKAITNWKEEYSIINNISIENVNNSIFLSKIIKANEYLEKQKNDLFVKISNLEYTMSHNPEKLRDFALAKGQQMTLIKELFSKTGKTFEQVVEEKITNIKNLEMKSISNLNSKVKSAKIYDLKGYPEKLNPLNTYHIMFDLETGGKSNKSSGISQFTALVFEKDKNNKVVNCFYIDQYINPEQNMKPIISYSGDGTPVLGNISDKEIVAYKSNGEGLKESEYKIFKVKFPEELLFDENKKEIINMYSIQEPEAVEVHKISNDKVSKEKGFWAYGEDIQNLFADSILYAHNGIKFDIPFIEQMLKIYPPENLKLEYTKIYDTRDIARDLIPPFILQDFLNGQIKKQVLLSDFSEDIDNTKLYTLDNLSRAFNIDLSERITTGHDAKIDTKIMAILWNNLVKVSEEITQNSDLNQAFLTGMSIAKEVRRKVATLKLTDPEKKVSTRNQLTL